jgi:diacylglycerol kinase (ATP)
MKGRQGLQRVLNAARYSWQGLREAWRHESAFQQEVVIAALLLPAAAILGTTWMERALLAGTVVVVLVVELLNSAIEAAVDRTSLEMHPLAGRAKDMGSAAVLLSLLLCAGTWGGALGARLLN